MKDHLGFTYSCKILDKHGRVRDEWEVENLMPTEGLSYLFNAAFRGGATFSSWYISLFSGIYTPVVGVTASSYPVDATEITSGYSETTRKLLVPDSTTTAFTNTASPAVFTFTGTVTVRGLGLHSVSTKGGTTGVLVSCAAFSPEKVMTNLEQLTITTTVSLP